MNYLNLRIISGDVAEINIEINECEDLVKYLVAAYLAQAIV